MNSKVVYLLGAGASKDAGLPLASEITKSVVESLNSTESRAAQNYDLGGAMNYIVAAIVGHRGKQGISPEKWPDIESVVSAIELLNDRSDLEIAPFIQNWDPTVDTLDKRRAFSTSWPQEIRKGILGPEHDHDLESGLLGFMSEKFRLGASEGTYAALMLEMFIQLKKHLSLNATSNTNYFDPLVQQAREKNLCIATLNYDLTVETAALRNSVPCNSGLDSWNDKWTLLWPDTGIKLLKLHGSIDWGVQFRSIQSQNPDLLLPDSVVNQVKNPLATRSIPFVIYGRREKLRPTGPFTELRSEFISELRSATHMVVIGYSFSDDHINEIVKKWMNSDLQRKLVVIDPKFPADWNTAEGFQATILFSLQRQKGPAIRTIEATRVLILRKDAREAISECSEGGDRLDHLFREFLDGQ